MAQQWKSPLHRTLVHDVIFPGVGFTLSVAYATRRYDLSALVTGLAITCTIVFSWRLDRLFIKPRLLHLPQDWLQLELEMTFLLFEHVLGALFVLFVCGRIFGFSIEGTTPWIVVGGMVIAFPIVHGTETALGFYRQLQQKERMEERLRALATQAELRALKAQINPHFLFNTLNTIAALIHTDPPRAEATVERLAELLRYVLKGSEGGMVPLAEELAFVDSYLQIESARFDQRLRVTREIDPDALEVLTPSLILQPLVENVVQHGQGDDGSIDLNIHVRSSGEEVRITVTDQGPGMPLDQVENADQGFGFRNVDERLRKTFGETYGVQVAANAPRGTAVTVRIPKGEGE